jgi:hypothetical protein
MSDRSMWKMLHLLYTLPPGQNGLSDAQLGDLGIDCGPDTFNPLESSGAVTHADGVYSLTEPARRILGTCVVANRRWSSDDLWVDHPSAFVVMPFSEPWSDTVYRQMIEPAVRDAGLECLRGDTLVRVGDLGQNLWGALLHAGIVVADVSAPNVNVFYELGLAHALGKDAVILKQAGSAVPADIGGAHYGAYTLDALDEGRKWLAAELTRWADEHQSQAVKALRRR